MGLWELRSLHRPHWLRNLFRRQRQVHKGGHNNVGEYCFNQAVRRLGYCLCARLFTFLSFHIFKFFLGAFVEIVDDVVGEHF